MKRRIIALTLTTILGITALMGCSSTQVGSNKTTESTEITFWHSMGGKGGEAINSLVEEFNNSQEEVKVVAEYHGSYDDSINKLKSSALSNSGPDVMQLYDIGTKWMIDSEYAIPMQDIVDKNDYDISKLEENIADYYTIDGKLYSMPFNSSTPILFYNKTALTEAGLTENDLPTNFNEIIEVAMMVASTANLGDLKSKIGDSFELGTAYFPAVLEGDKGGVSVGGASLWIMDKDDEEREDAAFEFIKFMVSSESQVKWAQATGYFSVSTEAYELPEMVEYLDANPQFKTAIEQLREDNNNSGAVLGVFPEARAAIEENIEKVLNS